MASKKKKKRAKAELPGRGALESVSADTSLLSESTSAIATARSGERRRPPGSGTVSAKIRSAGEHSATGQPCPLFRTLRPYERDRAGGEMYSDRSRPTSLNPAPERVTRRAGSRRRPEVAQKSPSHEIREAWRISSAFVRNLKLELSFFSQDEENHEVSLLT